MIELTVGAVLGILVSLAVALVLVSSDPQPVPRPSEGVPVVVVERLPDIRV
jgi:hypothetical protein